ncbi:MAG TPA: hypothetical protein VNK26_06010, partial [Pyrinomonadaceae bacterium]|nr:hypothetical protein [Pyrinomonadaceae bacterium]
MSRIVDTTLFPELTTQIPTQQNNRPCRIFGPRSIDGISGIRSYSAIAHKALERSGWAVCGPIRSHRLLKKAIYDCGNKADPEGLARAIRPELSEILRTGIDPEVLKKSASDRVKLLGNIASAYKRSLEKLKLVDREATLISALRLSTFERESTIFWGSFLARPIESRREEIDFIDAVAGDGSVYYLPLADSPLFKVNKDAVEYLKERGWIINNANSSQPETVGEKAALRFAGLTQDPVTAEGYYFESAEEEIRWVLGHIKYLIHKGESASKIAVAVREPLSYQTLIRSIADEYGLPIDIEFHQRIGLSLIGHAIWLIGEVFSEAECDFESTLRLLNYPGTKFWSKEKIARVLRSHPENKSEWFEIYEIPPIEVPDGKHTAEEWSIWLIGVLEALGLNESFSASASEAMNYLLIEELLNEISQLSGRSEVSLQGFFAELNNALETLSFQTMETRGGIVICEPHALIGRKFDHAFFIGAAEGHLPKVTSNSWILDFYEREELIQNGVNISPITEFARWEHFNFFFALSAVNKSIFLTYPSYLNGELLPSEYFDLLGIVPSRPHKNFISSQSELLINELPNKGQSKAVDLNPALFQKSKQAYKAESERLVANTDPVYNGLVKSLQIEKDKSWSVSELIDLGQCPFRWLARWAMRLERFEVAADEPA